jgi:carbon storage regulator CsrA
MLVVTRKTNERIFCTVPTNEGNVLIAIKVCDIRREGAKVRIGIQAPANVKIVREDLMIKMRKQEV